MLQRSACAAMRWCWSLTPKPIVAVTTLRVHHHQHDIGAGASRSPRRNYCYTHHTETQIHPETGMNEAQAPALVNSPLPPLEDRHGRRHDYLRISLTERCNLRCQYCMPAAGVPLSARSELLTLKELTRLVRVFCALGVRRVRLTGGEPTLRPDLPEVISAVRECGVQHVALTTNGVTLTRRLPHYQRAGLALDALNVSLDTMRSDRYETISRRPAQTLARVLAGVELALQLGFRPVKLNVVLIKGFNDDELCDFVEYIREREVHVRFIEFMPFSGNEWTSASLVPYREALRSLAARHHLRPLRTAPNHTAKMWEVEGHSGRVGFITSMTQHFCSSCNRLRLTADGHLKVCLFGAAEVSLRDAVRAGASDAELTTLVRAALREKHPRHAARSMRMREQAVPLQARGYCTGGVFTHLDGEGRARMVDVGKKVVTRREARAECALVVGARLLRLLRDAALPKGDALTVAQVAGALAAKRTSDLIPLCHPLLLECARVHVSLPTECGGEGGGRVRVQCSVAVTARTGAEMEALTGAAVAALALYDMCKSVDKDMIITDLRVTHKSGGTSSPPSPPSTSTPEAPSENYAPTNFTF